MFKRITSTLFKAAIVLVAIAAVVVLTVSGHTTQIGGLMLAMWAILGAVLFGFELTESFRSDRLSIWPGPLASVRSRMLSARKGS